MSSTISLKDRHTDATRELILTTAIDLLEKAGVTDLTVRSVAKAAGMSERTVFRYFATRDEFLDAVAAEAVRRMQPPSPPSSVQDLPEYPAALYKSFEESKHLIEASLHTEIFKRVRGSAARGRWAAITQMIDDYAPHLPKKERQIAATNINYYLSASTWYYFRFNFEFSLKDTIDCARSAIRLTVEDIGKQNLVIDADVFSN